MFEQIQQGWHQEKQRNMRWVVYRGWIGVAIALAIILVQWLEKNAK